MPRLSWIEYYMQIAKIVANQSTCVRRQVGAVAVLNNNIIATGFNGAPSKIKHCTIDSCYRKIHNIPSGQNHELCMAVHAEMNLITSAAKNGTIVNGATVYSTHKPCSLCIKIMINAGIKEVIFDDDYPDKFTDYILNDENNIGHNFKIKALSQL